MEESIQSLKEKLTKLQNEQRVEKVKNVKTEVQADGILVIEIDLGKEFGKSKSGKTDIISSTGGFIPIPDSEGFFLNINVIKR